MRSSVIKLALTFLSAVVLLNASARAQRAELVVQTGHSDSVDSVAFSPDGRLLASGSFDLKLWDVASGLELKSLGRFEYKVLSIAFSPDGRLLAGGSGDGTARIWEVSSGKEVRSWKAHSSNLNSVAFSPDGRTLATGGGDKVVKLWDAATGRELLTLKGHSEVVASVAFSPNGKVIASGSWDKTIKLWDAASGREMSTLAGHGHHVLAVAFSPDGRMLASASADDTVKLWDVATQSELKTLRGHDATVESVVFSPDGKTVISAGWYQDSGGNNGTIRLWDVETGRERKIIESQYVSFIALSRDGRTLASNSIISGDLIAISLWDLRSGREVKTLVGHSHYVRSIIFSPDKKTVAYNSLQDTTVKLWDVSSGKGLRSLVGHARYVSSIAFSPDSKTLASSSYDGAVKLWDVATGRELKTLAGHSGEADSLAFSPDGATLVSGGEDGFKLWDVSSGRLMKGAQLPRVKVVAFSPDGGTLASVNEVDSDGNGFLDTGEIKLWDLDSGKLSRTIRGDVSTYFLSFSPDGRTLAGGGETLKLWDVKTGQEVRPDDRPAETPFWLRDEFSKINGRAVRLQSDGEKVNLLDSDTGQVVCTLIALDENDWAVVTPDGLFDASHDARKLLHYVIGFEPIVLEQMKDIYYVPGLLRKIFKGEPLPKVELFAGRDLFPSVEYEPLRAGQKQLTVRLKNRGGGIGPVQVLFNGKELTADARPAGFNPNAPTAVVTVDMSKAPVRAGEENRVEVVARNASGSLSNRGARGAEIVYVDEGRKRGATPNIYAIVGGISDYTGDGLKLRFAAKDAEDFARALELGAVKLLGGDSSKVHIRLLTSDGDRSGVRFSAPDAKVSTATKSDFSRAFADFRDATPDDVFVVYLAGHGVSLNLNQNPARAGGDTYLYLTQEATTTDKGVLAVDGPRRAMAISSEELKDLMKQNRALKQVLILDTCAAGVLSNSLVGGRDLPGDQIRAIERLKDSTGFFVLMGAAADAASYEASQYGQGLLTYSLLQGMKGARLRENQFADVGLLFGYAQDVVPTLAKNIGGIQRPLVITPDTSSSFDIGRFTADEQRQITLSSPKPLILSPTLLNERLKRDDQNLTQLLKQHLRDLSYAGSARGGPSPLVFVEADEMTDAIMPSGLYTVEGDTLKVSVVLYRNGKQIGEEISVSGKTGERESLIRQLVAEMIKAAN